MGLSLVSRPNARTSPPPPLHWSSTLPAFFAFRVLCSGVNQAFPRLIILVKNNRGNKKPLKDSCTQASGTPGLAEGPACTNCSNRDGNGVGEGTPSDEGSANEGDFSYIPALWALLNVVKGVPSEALSPELDSVIPAVVQALRSGHIPLQTAAVETFQVREVKSSIKAKKRCGALIDSTRVTSCGCEVPEPSSCLLDSHGMVFSRRRHGRGNRHGIDQQDKKEDCRTKDPNKRMQNGCHPPS